MKDLTVVPKTVMALEIIRVTIQDLEVLMDEEKIVPSLGICQTAFRRSGKEKSIWFHYEAVEIAALFNHCRCPKDEDLFALRDRHLKLRKQMQTVLEKAA